MKKLTTFFTGIFFLGIIVYSFSVIDTGSEEHTGPQPITIKGLYAKGEVPINIGMPDTVIVDFSSNITSGTSLLIRIIVYDLNANTSYDTTYSRPRGSIFGEIIRFRLHREFQPKNDLIVVRALAGELLDNHMGVDTLYDSTAYCQDITEDTYNYAEPCRNAAGGFGIRGATGNFVAQFRNNDSGSIVIGSVVQSFFDSVGSGNKPYNIVIYGDSNNSKPGSLKYISPNLTTPPGTGAANEVTYQIDSLVTIPANSRFYIGYRQTTLSRVNASFQTENPVRKNSFFFTSSNSGNTWHDFADSAYNNRFDISPVLGKTILNLNYIMQGFYGGIVAGKLNMRDTVKVYLRQSGSPYAIVDTAIGKIDSITFKKSFSFNNISTGNYYIDVRHRNCIETWSSAPVSFTKKATTNYNMTSTLSQAYGSNMIQVNASPLRVAAYSGDVNQEGFVDLTDVTLVFNDASSFTTGYVKTDVNGDDLIDLTDLTITFNNSTSFVQKITP